MNILITAGNTIEPIDRVRCITNIFTGRTGTQIALHAREHGHSVTLLTSHPELVNELNGPAAAERWAVHHYRTFDDLQEVMQAEVRHGELDAVIHSAAVSDYRAGGIYAPSEYTRFRSEDGHWESSVPELPALVNKCAGKVKSDEPELWLRLVRTPKLIDQVRSHWGFRGILVKFKLEVGASDEQLLEIAEQSRRQSAADFLVANTLEGHGAWAYLGPIQEKYQRVSRCELAERLLEAVTALHKERCHG